jgi:hypothetical protein
VATVSIAVSAVNDAPVANPQSLTVNQNSSNNSVVLTGSDVEGSALTYTVITQPAHGTLLELEQIYLTLRQWVM